VGIMKIQNKVKLILLIVPLLILTGCGNELSKNGLSKNENYDFSNISTKNVYKIWRETSIGTDISSLAHQELTKRGYWDKDKEEEKKKAIEIFNKYNND